MVVVGEKAQKSFQLVAAKRNAFNDPDCWHELGTTLIFLTTDISTPLVVSTWSTPTEKTEQRKT